MVVRGAPAIGCAAAYGVAVESMRLARALRSAIRRGDDRAFSVLAASRPTAVNLFWALGENETAARRRSGPLARSDRGRAAR